jgi:hypothetical protein
MRKHVNQYVQSEGPVFFKHPTDEELFNLQKAEVPESVRYIDVIDVRKIREIVHNITPEQLHYLQNHEKEMMEALMKNRRVLKGERKKHR